MAHLNWKGTIRMKYSPRLKEIIISIFHNSHSRISKIHVIFTKVDFQSPKAPFGAVSRGLRWFWSGLLNILCIIWSYAVFNTIIFGFGNHFILHIQNMVENDEFEFLKIRDNAGLWIRFYDGHEATAAEKWFQVSTLLLS